MTQSSTQNLALSSFVTQGHGGMHLPVDLTGATNSKLILINECLQSSLYQCIDSSSERQGMDSRRGLKKGTPELRPWPSSHYFKALPTGHIAA